MVDGFSMRWSEEGIMKEAEVTCMLAEDLGRFYDDPYGYVMYIFPWEQKGTPLENFSGPKKWQEKYLKKLGRDIKARGFDGSTPVDPIRKSTASGHGIGKSALTAWLIKFISDTRPFSKGVVTANTADQLRTKTWGELGKWHEMSLTRSYFIYSATRGGMSLRNKQHPETWRCDALTCREENSEAFAGQHTANSTSFYIFDESSAIPEKIFEVAQGGLTDGEPMFFLFGNPTRNTGFFRSTFGKLRHRWDTLQIDSRTVEGTNKKLFAEWVVDYGIDDDFCKVRILGQFPSSSVTQFIPMSLVEEAQKRKLHSSQYSFAPRILGIDVAWEGDDRSSIVYRQGLFSKVLFKGVHVDPKALGTLVIQFEDELHIDATFVDRGAGAGLITYLQLLGRSPIAINFGHKSMDPAYYLMRSKMWGGIKTWLEGGGSLDDGQEMCDDLVGVEYQRRADGSIQLETKKSMKDRDLASPDLGDGLALTFAQPVNRKSEMEEFEESLGLTPKADMCVTEYNVFDD